MSSEPDQLLSIGAFARRSRLSLKALRIYEKSGLLVPAAVDLATGYRRYRESQLPAARLIVMMRRAGSPLAQVSAIAAAPGPAAAKLLAEYWEEAEHRFGVQRDLVSRLRTSLLRGAVPGQAGAPNIQLREVPDQLVLCEKRRVPITELNKWLPRTIGRLIGVAAEHGGVDGEVFVVFHGEVNEDSDGPVEVCVPAAGPVSARSAAAQLVAAHLEAYLTITRAELEFPQILSGYDAVADWISGAGMTPAGPPREVYRCGIDVATAAPEVPVCDIAFPVRIAKSGS